MIFTIYAILAFLVPDVPAEVQNEIKKEKLLAYEAIHKQLAVTSPKHKKTGYTGDND